ncbi:MAG: hypothetical protein NTY87_03650 [Planctomycetia bacterium]|nr:hypothetical protein [Planctomycetia bacterium]RLT14064.1 MAG: hypothetical protein DWI25_05725 [Planctomycetota bacterium]
MDNPLQILLISPDLLSTSRIAGLAKDFAGRVETLRNLDNMPHGGPFDLILLDTGAVPGDPAVIVARCLTIIEMQRALAEQSGKHPKLIAFGPHVAKQRLEDSKSAGAFDTVSRGELLGSFSSLVKRWCR